MDIDTVFLCVQSVSSMTDSHSSVAAPMFNQTKPLEAAANSFVLRVLQLFYR